MFKIDKELIHAMALQERLEKVDRKQFPHLYHEFTRLLELACAVASTPSGSAENLDAQIALEEYLR